MSEAPILEFDAVTVASANVHITDLSEISMRVGAGDLVVVAPERHVETVSFYDVASGLIAPDQGVVHFDGRDWQKMSLYHQSACRGRIGRVFEGAGWVSNLNMFENIALASRHHTTRSDRLLHKATHALLERIGLRDCLAERPHGLSRGDLRRAQWVRALLGDPALLLLNAPLMDIRPNDQTILIELVGEARARGAAVIWMSRDVESLTDRPGFDAARHGCFSAGRLRMSNADQQG